LAWLEGRQGREAACLEHVEEALSIAGEVGLRLCEIWANAALGDLHLAHSRAQEAMAHFSNQQSLLERCAIADVDSITLTTKRAGYVMAAVTVGEPSPERAVIRGTCDAG
jgi:hypothetical protein